MYKIALTTEGQGLTSPIVSASWRAVECGWVEGVGASDHQGVW